MTDFVNASGMFVVDASAESADAMVKISIPRGTVAGNQNGQRLNFISIKEKSPPFQPPDITLVCPVYDIGPAGFNFDPPITLTFRYRDADVPAGALEENMVIVP